MLNPKLADILQYMTDEQSEYILDKIDYINKYVDKKAKSIRQHDNPNSYKIIKLFRKHGFQCVIDSNNMIVRCNSHDDYYVFTYIISDNYAVFTKTGQEHTYYFGMDGQFKKSDTLEINIKMSLDEAIEDIMRVVK